MSERPPPYPADTRAKGWRLELDYEKIEQSSTWDLAAEVPMAQHALLMMWYVAWRQEPCGTFPDDHEIIRAKCKVPRKAWEQMRPILMRGWWLASDGLLYHDTITARVLSMLDKRASDAERAATRRQRKADSAATPPELTPESRVTHTGVHPEFDTKHQAPEEIKDPPATRVPPWSPPAWMPDAQWEAFVAMRKAKGKRAPFTAAARDGIVAALSKFRDEGHDVGAILQASVVNGWSGVFPPKPQLRAVAGGSPASLDDMFRRGQA